MKSLRTRANCGASVEADMRVNARIDWAAVERVARQCRADRANMEPGKWERLERETWR